MVLFLELLMFFFRDLPPFLIFSNDPDITDISGVNFCIEDILLISFTSGLSVCATLFTPGLGCNSAFK